MEATPFVIARQTLEQSSPVRIITAQTGQRIDFLTSGDDGSVFPSRIEHLLKDETIVFGVQHAQLFVPWSGYIEFFHMVDKCVSAICEREERSLRGYVVPVFHERVLAMQYIIPIHYGSLGNQEYADELCKAFKQGSVAILQIFAIIHAIHEKGGTPSELECMQSIYRTLAMLASPPSLDQASSTRH